MRAETTARVNRAVRLVSADRNECYGDPAVNMERTAALWSPILGTDVSPKQVALCMVCVKLARECHTPRADNLDDVLGWGIVAIECQAEELETVDLAARLEAHDAD